MSRLFLFSGTVFQTGQSINLKDAYADQKVCGGYGDPFLVNSFGRKMTFWVGVWSAAAVGTVCVNSLRGKWMKVLDFAPYRFSAPPFDEAMVSL